MGLLSWLDPIIDIGTAWSNRDAARDANRTNIKLARENRDWEKEMSDTAVQRRRLDIERAGGNPALAFTNGAEASTPTAQPAKVDAPQLNAKGRFNEARMAAAQIDNLKANTASQVASAKKAGADTDLSVALAAKARVEQLATLTTAEKTRADIGLVADQKREILQRISNLVSEKKLKDLEAQLKGLTLEDSAKLIQAQARSGELGLSAKRNEATVADTIRETFFGKSAKPGPKRFDILKSEPKPKKSERYDRKGYK